MGGKLDLMNSSTPWSLRMGVPYPPKKRRRLLRLNTMVVLVETVLFILISPHDQGEMFKKKM